MLGVSLRSGSLRLYAAEPGKTGHRWKKQWPFPDLRWIGERWVEPDMEDVFTAYSQGYDAVLETGAIMNRGSFGAIASVAYKEFLHIYRDRRVLMLAPDFAAGFHPDLRSRLRIRRAEGRAGTFRSTRMTPRGQSVSSTGSWQTRLSPGSSRLPGGGEEDLLGQRRACEHSSFPSGWSESLTNGDPIPLQLYLDGSDTSTAEQLQGSLQKTLGDFQVNERDRVDRLRCRMKSFNMAKKLPVEVRKQFVSAMEAVEGRGIKCSTTRRSASSITSCRA